jgi:hypothetical protein
MPSINKEGTQSPADQGAGDSTSKSKSKDKDGNYEQGRSDAQGDQENPPFFAPAMPGQTFASKRSWNKEAVAPRPPKDIDTCEGCGNELSDEDRGWYCNKCKEKAKKESSVKTAAWTCPKCGRVDTDGAAYSYGACPRCDEPVTDPGEKSNPFREGNVKTASYYEIGDKVETGTNLKQTGWKNAVPEGTKGEIIDVSEQNFAFGTFTDYKVKWDNGEVNWVGNGHMLLHKVASEYPEHTCQSCGKKYKNVKPLDEQKGALGLEYCPMCRQDAQVEGSKKVATGRCNECDGPLGDYDTGYTCNKCRSKKTAEVLSTEKEGGMSCTGACDDSAEHHGNMHKEWPPEKIGTFEKEGKAAPGWEGTVKHMKNHPEITNPWALSWYESEKGYKPHK